MSAVAVSTCEIFFESKHRPDIIVRNCVNGTGGEECRSADRLNENNRLFRKRRFADHLRGRISAHLVRKSRATLMKIG